MNCQQCGEIKTEVGLYCGGCEEKSLARTCIRTPGEEEVRQRGKEFRGSALWCLLVANAAAVLVVLQPLQRPLQFSHTARLTAIYPAATRFRPAASSFRHIARTIYRAPGIPPRI